MQRILILTHEHPPFRGGIATVGQGLAVGAASLGFDTHVLAPAHDGSSREWDAAQPYEISRFPGDTCSILSFDKLRRFAVRCHRAIQDVKPHIIHAVDPPSQMAVSALSRLRLVKNYFFTVHGSELLRYKTELFPRLWMYGAFKRVTRISAVSRHVYGLLLENHNVSPGGAFVSYPGISPRWFEPAVTDRIAVRSKWSVRSDDLVLLTVARCVPEKGHQAVIGGLARLVKPLRSRAVYVVGGSGPESYMRNLAEQAKSESVQLRLLGALSEQELVEVYDAADVFMMLSKQTPKRVEGLGLVYLEAGARGVPSIAANTGGVSEVVRDGETGLLLTAGPTAEQIAHAIQRLAERREVRDRMGQRAKEFAGEFTWTRNAKETYERFSEALDTRVQRSRQPPVSAQKLTT